MPNWDVEALSRVERLLVHASEDHTIPGAVVAIGQGSSTAWQAAIGFAEAHPYHERPMTLDTRFDLASLTKVTSTLPLILRLVEGGVITLTDPVQQHLPEFRGPGKAEVTLGHLLAHMGGLLWHREFFRTLTGHAVVDAAIAEPLVYAPGSRVAYSDLGFILLGEIASRLYGMPLEEAARVHVFQPLGMSDTSYLPQPREDKPIAATEALPGRGGPKVGVVHDDNTEAMGGVAGHAGLFSTVPDLSKYAAMWAGVGPHLISPDTRRAAVMCVVPSPARRGLGWVLRGDAMDHMGDLWPPTAFGHTGYTGTSLAIDAASGRWAVLLTNRVHFGRHVDITRLRRLVHNAVMAAAR